MDEGRRHWSCAAATACLMLLASACSFSCRGGQEPPAVVFETATIKVNGKPIVVEVANTVERRDRGLMYRDSLAPDRGMLFVYKQEDTLSFWMKDTRVPLDIAFLKADGWICDVQQMDPKDLESHRSEMQARFALEMNQGWFAANGVKVGDTVEIPNEVANSAH